MRYYLTTLILIIAFATESCTNTSTQEAQTLLEQSRKALAESRFDDAKRLIDTLRNSYPRETDVRRVVLPLADSIELLEARETNKQTDSLMAYMEFELTDAKAHFTYEKDEKYQSQGYYVLPHHAGNKKCLVFFPEVEESGKLLLVQVNTQRKYNFTEVPISDDGYIPYIKGMNLTENQQQDVATCYALSKLILQYDSLKQQQEKTALKVRFFEERLKKASQCE